jgi:hypothetical protein
MINARAALETAVGVIEAPFSLVRYALGLLSYCDFCVSITCHRLWPPLSCSRAVLWTPCTVDPRAPKFNKLSSGRKCQLTGQKANNAMVVTFSHKRNKKLQHVNLQKKKVYWPEVSSRPFNFYPFSAKKCYEAADRAVGLVMCNWLVALIVSRYCADLYLLFPCFMFLVSSRFAP